MEQMQSERGLVCVTWSWVMVGHAQPFMGYKEHEYVWQVPAFKCREGFATEADAWSAAAAFTRERLEEVRQLQRDTDGCRGTVAAISEMAAYQIDKGEGSRVALTVRALYSACRILYLHQSTLADKTSGMKAGAF